MLKCEGFAEALRDYIAANSSLGLTVGSTFTLGNILDVDNLDEYLGGSTVVLSMYDEGGAVRRTGRRHHQERSIRFIYKGSYGQEAVNRVWLLLEWLENERHFPLDDFTCWLARIDSAPSVIAASQNGVYLADCVVTFLVINRTG